MTRNENMTKCAIDYEWRHQDEMTDPADSFMLRDAYCRGWKAADNNPVNQWKDINKEQPPKDELPFLISYDDYGDFVGKETCFWSEGAYRLCSDGRSFEELEPWYHITHWMPIPELPKKED